MLVGRKDDFEVIFSCELQYYTVFYKDKILVDKKYKFVDVKSYLE